MNDNSDKEYCYGPLQIYIKDHFDTSKIKTLLMSKRFGLMAARLAGARAATGDILIFQDCHTEVNVNWIPPLIEPIAMDYRTVVCPYIDVISAEDYNYRGITQGARGEFITERKQRSESLAYKTVGNFNHPGGSSMFVTTSS